MRKKIKLSLCVQVHRLNELRPSQAKHRCMTLFTQSETKVSSHVRVRRKVCHALRRDGAHRPTDLHEHSKHTFNR